MIIIPAIDLHEGSVVRLKQGAFDAITTYSDDPAAVARSFAKAGAKRIHVVDLDGSLVGEGVNLKAIAAICKAVKVDVELGGGIRSIAQAQRAFDLGVRYVILGTVAVKDPDTAKEIIAHFPGRVGIGIDALNGLVAVHGWKEVSELEATELARSYAMAGPAFLVYTDISRDGMLSGPNIPATAAIAVALDIPVIASGGVSCLEDLQALAAIPTIFGAITGKAVYEGRLDVASAIKTIEQT